MLFRQHRALMLLASVLAANGFARQPRRFKCRRRMLLGTRLNPSTVYAPMLSHGLDRLRVVPLPAAQMQIAAEELRKWRANRRSAPGCSGRAGFSWDP